MKKFLILLSIFVLVFTVNVFATSPVKVLMNDEYIDFTDENNQVVNPEITNSRTMVPLRKIFETLGAKVEWDNDTRTVIAQKDGVEIRLTIGSQVAYIIKGDVTTNYVLDSVAYIKDGRTLVPLRFISESLGCLVGWNQEEQTAIIISIEELTKEVLAECTNLNEFITTVKSDDSKYIDMDFSYEANPYDEEDGSASAKFNIFNTDESLILNVIKVIPDEEGLTGKYYDAGTITQEVEDESDVVNILGSMVEDEDIQKGTYTLVKEKAIEFLNNDKLKINKKGSKKTYELTADIPLDMGFVQIDIDAKLSIETKDDIIQGIDIEVILVDAGEIDINIDIEYLDTAKKVPSNVELLPITDLMVDM